MTGDANEPAREIRGGGPQAAEGRALQVAQSAGLSAKGERPAQEGSEGWLVWLGHHRPRSVSRSRLPELVSIPASVAILRGIAGCVVSGGRL